MNLGATGLEVQPIVYMMAMHVHAKYCMQNMLFSRLVEGSFSLATAPGRCWSTAWLTASLAELISL